MLGACTAHPALQAPTRMLGMSRSDLMACVGRPGEPALIGGGPALSFTARISDSGQSANVETGGFMGLGVGRPPGSFTCTMTVSLAKGRVSSVDFSGDPPACDALAEGCVDR